MPYETEIKETLRTLSENPNDFYTRLYLRSLVHAQNAEICKILAFKE